MVASAQRDVQEGRNARGRAPTLPQRHLGEQQVIQMTLLSVILKTGEGGREGEGKRITNRDASQCVRNDTRSWEVGKEAGKQ